MMDELKEVDLKSTTNQSRILFIEPYACQMNVAD